MKDDCQNEWQGPPVGGAGKSAWDLAEEGAAGLRASEEPYRGPFPPPPPPPEVVAQLLKMPLAQKAFNQPQKFDFDKVRLELLPPEFLEGIGKVLTFGAKKYAAGNWASGDGFDWSRLYGALLRHMMAWANGEDIDPESGLSHLYHAGCMLAFLAAHVERGLGTDDRETIGIKRRK